MTETLLSPTVPAQREPQPVEVAPGDGDPDRSRRVKLFIGGGVAVALFGGWFLLHHGGSADTSSTSTGLPVVTHHAPKKAAAAPIANAAASPKVAPGFPGIIGRDPFKPLVQDMTTARGGAPGTGTAATLSAPRSTGASAPTTATAPTSTNTATTAAAPGATPLWIDLDSQNGTKSATFLVATSDGKTAPYANVVAPASGKTTAFGNGFQLVSLQDGFAVVQFGQNKPFNVEQGYANRHMLS